MIENREYVVSPQRQADLVAWLDRYGFEMWPAQDGESVLLVRRVNGTAEVLAVAPLDDDALVAGEALREQAEGMRVLHKTGYVGCFALREEQLWNPGELVLRDRSGVEVFRGTGSTWNEVIRNALAWACEARLETGMFAAAEA